MSKFNLVAQLQLQAPGNTQAIVNQIQKQLNSIGVNVKLNSNVRNIRATSSAIGLIDTESRRASSSVGELGRTMGIAARRFGAISIATGGFLYLTRAIKNSVSEAILFERELNKITQATGATGKALSNISNRVTELSAGLGVSSKELIGAARTLAQAGFSAKNTAGALKILAQTELAATFDSIADTTEGVIATIQQFGKEALKSGKEIEFLEQSLSAINTVSKLFAVESSDIISAIRKTGGSFEAAGGNINELIALFTSVRATTRESADTIATAFRTIFTRLQRTDTIDALKELGIVLQDSTGKFVGPLKAIEQLSIGLSVLDTKDFRFSQIVEELGGFRQIGKVIPLVKQFAITQEALSAAQKASGSLALDAATAQQTLAVRITKVQESFLALVRDFTSSDTFQTMASFALDFANALISVGQAIKPILPLVTAFAAIQLGKTLIPAIGAFSGFSKRNQGGPIHKFAKGGFVPGSGNGDTVPAMLSPGEFVIKKSSAAKMGADALHGMNAGGAVQYFAEGGNVKNNIRSNIQSKSRKGGILDQDRVGILVLESQNTVAKSQKDRTGRINSKMFGDSAQLFDQGKINKEYGVIRSGISDNIKNNLSSNIRSSISQGLFNAIETTGELFAPELKINTPLVREKYNDKFLSSVGEDTIGTMFEAMIASISDPSFSKTSDKNRPFDFIGSLNKAERLFDGSTRGIKYRDAKSTLNAASPSSLMEKVVNQAKREAYGFKGQEGPGRDLSSLLSGKTNLSNADLNNILPGVKKNAIVMENFLKEKVGEGNFTKTPKGQGFIYSFAKFAKGGAAGSDTVPAMLTPGEFVVKKSSAEKIGYDELNHMNRTGTPKGYAKGGPVKGSSGKGVILDPSELKANSLAGGYDPSQPGGAGTPRLFKPAKTQSYPDRRANRDAAELSSNAPVSAPTKNSGNFLEGRTDQALISAKVQKAAEKIGPVFEQLGVHGAELDDIFRTMTKLMQKGISTEDALNKSTELVTKGRIKEVSKVQRPTIGSNGPGSGPTPTGPSATGSGNNPGTQAVNRASGQLAQNFLFMGGAITSVVGQMGLFDKETANLVSQFAVTAASVYGISSTILEGVGSLKLFSNTSKIAAASNTVEAVASGVSAAADIEESFASKMAAAKGSIAQGALIGLSVGIAAAGVAISEYTAAQKKASESAATEVKSVKEGGKGSLESITKKLQDATRSGNQASAATVGGYGGAAGGALGGAAAGAALGSIVPVLGTAIGAALGGIVGGIVGGFGGAKAGAAVATTSNPELAAAEYSAKAQYSAAKATYDFTKSLEDAKQKNLSSRDSLKSLTEQTNRLNKAQVTAKVASRQAEINRTKTVSSFGAVLGYTPENSKTEADITNAAAEKASIEELATTAREAATQLKSSTDQQVSEIIASSKSAIVLKDVLKDPAIQNALTAYKGALVESGKSQAEAETIVKSSVDVYGKQINAANENIVAQNALVAAKTAEVALILQTNTALNALVQTSRAFLAVQSNLDRTIAGLDGSFKSIPTNLGAQLGDITKVGNQSDFANTAQQAAAPLGAAGQVFANQVISSAQAIEKLRTGLNIKNVESATKNQLSGDAGKGATKQLLEGIIGKDVFKGLGKDMQDALVGSIQASGGKDANINQDTIQGIIKQFETNAQGAADVLKQTADLSDQYLSQYDQVTTAIIASMNKEADLRSGLINIQQVGQDRLAEVFKGKLSAGQQDQLLKNKDTNTTRAAQATLGPTLGGVKAGNVSSLAGTLKTIQARSTSNNTRLNRADIGNRDRSVTEGNQKQLADASVKVTNELKRLADQSAKASDIMGQISKEQAKREFASGQVEDFVLGTQESRQKQAETFQGANIVAQTGSFQGLPEEMRKGVGDLLKQIADLEPGGAADKVRKGAIQNDAIRAGLPPQVAQALANATPKEEKLIQDLRILNEQEKAAQQALIDAERVNTDTATRLLGGVNNLLNVMANNIKNGPQALQAPIVNQPAGFAQNNGAPQAIDQGLGKLVTSMEMLSQNFNNMQMTHTVNVTGQVNVAGFNGEQIGKAITDSVGQFVISVVNQTLNDRQNSLRTG